MERVGRPMVIGVLAVLLAVATGAAYHRLRDDRIALGDKGRVTATADVDCAHITIEHDGLVLKTMGGVPLRWKGRQVEGELVLDAHTGRDGEERVEGTFTGDDGTVLTVDGGPDGTFFKASCALWSSDR